MQRSPRYRGATSKAASGRIALLQLQLIFITLGLGLILAAWAWLELANLDIPQQQRTASPDPVPEYEYIYPKILSEQEVQVTPAPTEPRAQLTLYLWTRSHWRQGRPLEEVLAQIALTGIEASRYPASLPEQSYLKLGPFGTVSQRNNAREIMTKLNIQVSNQQPE
ncbi:MAG: hypothetical protein ACR2PW_00985 [Gammaproteobacteria bacterium]